MGRIWTDREEKRVFGKVKEQEQRQEVVMIGVVGKQRDNPAWP